MRKKEGKFICREFAKRFRTLMGNRNMTLREISDKTGKAVSTISTWRRGQIPRGENTREALAKAFGVSGGYLFNGTREKEETIFSNERRINAPKSEDEKNIEEARNIFEEILVDMRSREGGIVYLCEKLEEILQSIKPTRRNTRRKREK